MMTVIRFYLLCAFSLTIASPLALWAVDKSASPDFKELQQIVRDHLNGATEESINQAAVQGVLDAFKGKVKLLGTNQAEVTDEAPVASEEVFDGVGYVRVHRVEPGLAAKVAAAADKLSASNKLSGLILDLRYTGGDDYAAAAATVDLFLSREEPLLNAGAGLVSSTDKTNAIRLPVVALINSKTAAAAEALAAVLRHSGAGLLIGSRTTGDAAVTQDFVLSDGQTLRIATAPVQLGDAKAIPNSGVVPDIEVTVKPDDEKTFYADPFAESPESAADGATNGTPRRPRPSEAQLVREHRGDADFDLLTPAPPKPVEKPAIQDPALERAIDLLKGLAVVRQGKY